MLEIKTFASRIKAFSAIFAASCLVVSIKKTTFVIEYKD